MTKNLIYALLVSLAFTSCVSKKKFTSLQSELASTKADLERRGELVNDYKNKQHCEMILTRATKKQI